jgi:hypothetical protein
MPAEKKPKAGQPTKYRPNFCVRVLELGALGKSRFQIGADLGVCQQTLYNWEQTHPEFLEATTYARELSQAWWENEGQDGLHDRREVTKDEDGNKVTNHIAINSTMWAKQVSCRFPDTYRQQQTVEHVGDPVENQDALDNRKLARAVLQLIHKSNKADEMKTVEHQEDE